MEHNHIEQKDILNDIFELLSIVIIIPVSLSLLSDWTAKKAYLLDYYYEKYRKNWKLLQHNSFQFSYMFPQSVLKENLSTVLCAVERHCLSYIMFSLNICFNTSVMPCAD